MKQQTQKKKLDGLIRDLERELSEGKSQVAVLEETHRRLQESERICQELADENRRLGQEIKGWQGRLGESEEYQRQLGILRQQFDALQEEHARVVENNRRMEQSLSAATAAALAAQRNLPKEAVTKTAFRLTPQGETESVCPAETAINQSSVSARSGIMAKLAQLKLDWVIGNPRLSLGVAGVLVLLIASLVTIRAMMREEPLAPSAMSFPQETPSIDSFSEPVAKLPAAKVTAKPTPRVQGAFQTVRETSVFSGPSENTAIVANIGKGTKINVVDSNDGWLEIRSKHGRPPGFIRKEAAERMDEAGARRRP
jgi:hypothetical protein